MEYESGQKVLPFATKDLLFTRRRQHRQERVFTTSNIRPSLPYPRRQDLRIKQTSAPAHTKPISPHRKPKSKGSVLRDEAVATGQLARGVWRGCGRVC